MCFRRRFIEIDHRSICERDVVVSLTLLSLNILDDRFP